MDGTKIKYEDIKTSCEEMHIQAKNMKELLENINTNSKKLSSTGSWEGKAAEYFIKKTEKLTKNFDEIYIELENSILYLAKVSDGYQAIDENLMQEICNNLNIGEPSLGTSKIFS